MKSKRTKACAISPKIKAIVEERDSIDGTPCCIFCGKPGRGEAHYIARSQGGLGIEQNLVTACRICHGLMDNSTFRSKYLAIAKQHLMSHYENWNEDDLIYKKYQEYQ